MLIKFKKSEVVQTMQVFAEGVTIFFKINKYAHADIQIKHA